jgi:putative transposase
MPSSYVSNHVHIVFSTKNSLKVIPEDLQPKLWAYTAGIAKKHGMHAVAMGGIEDLVHALIDMGPTLALRRSCRC